MIDDDKRPSYWSYRVVRTLHRAEPERPTYAICEIYFDKDDRPMGGTGEISPWGEAVPELRRVLRMMLDAASKPVLAYYTKDGEAAYYEDDKLYANCEMREINTDPTDLTVPSFQRVSDIEGLDEALEQMASGEGTVRVPKPRVPVDDTLDQVNDPLAPCPGCGNMIDNPAHVFGCSLGEGYNETTS